MVLVSLPTVHIRFYFQAYPSNPTVQFQALQVHGVDKPQGIYAPFPEFPGQVIQYQESLIPMHKAQSGDEQLMMLYLRCMAKPVPSLQYHLRCGLSKAR